MGRRPAGGGAADGQTGSPAKVLIEQSANADLLVVGTRGHGGFRGLVLGWVSHHVAGYAQCSVTIVR
jgi:nucleotide-binding universal stress UspA family protein